MFCIANVRFVVIAASIFMSSCVSKKPQTFTDAEVVRKHLSSKEKSNISLLSLVESESKNFLDRNGRLTPELQEAFYEFEKKYYKQLDENSQSRFQRIVGEVGGKVLSPILMPPESDPFWLTEKGEFEGYKSTEHLPKSAGVVVVGAGLTGVSAVYHLSQHQENNSDYVLLEAGSKPASQATGRNGGNFQLLSESYVGEYTGLKEERLKWLRQKHKLDKISEEMILKEADYQAETILNFNLKNFQRFRSLVAEEKLDCDYSEEGWLRIAKNEDEEKALFRDTEWIQSQNRKGTPDSEIWSPQKIKEKVDISSKFSGRYIAKNGNYHPYKFVNALLRKSLSKGVKFYTGTKVLKVTKLGSVYKVDTNQGTIFANKVIVATNAQTAEIFPKLSYIKVVPSQIMNLEHIKNPLKGMTLTEEYGDIYYNFPKSAAYKDAKGNQYGMLHFGWDVLDHSINVSNRSIDQFTIMKKFTDERFPDSKGQPASRVWVGNMGFTDDRIPVIGFGDSKNLVFAVAFQGYGGSYCIHAGYVAAEMALTGVEHPDAPSKMFSPNRSFHHQNFLSSASAR